MDALLHDIIPWVLNVGPWVIFLVVAAETAFFIGLLVPAEATVLLGGFLVSRGYFQLDHVLIATCGGALLGDHFGYLLGRHYGSRVAVRGGLVGRIWRRYEVRATRLFRRRSVLAVTVARFVSFVRTLMPWFAGMSGMEYRRFLLYDLVGVIGWGAASVALGYLAGASWQLVAGAVGTASSVVIVLLLVIGVSAALRKRRVQEEIEEALTGEPADDRDWRRIALTGNIASGKSVVARVWRGLGAAIIDADELARQAVEPGSQALARIVERFGEQMVSDGELDRARLRAHVFADPAERAALEAIVHPEVARLRRAAEARLVAGGERIIVHEIPLLFEAGLEAEFDTVVLVDAPEATRVRRIIDDRGLSEGEAKRMVAAQMPTGGKRARATHVLDNVGTLGELERAAAALWQELNAEAS